MTNVGSNMGDGTGVDRSVVGSDIRDGLRAIIAQALALPPDEIADDRLFLEIATSSLALVDAVGKVSDRFGVRLSLRRVFEEFGTIGRLETYVTQLVSEQPSRLAYAPREPVRAPEDRSERLPLSAAQEQLVFLSDLRPEAAAAWSETVAV